MLSIAGNKEGKVKRLPHINLYYLIGTVPFCFGIMYLTIFLLHSSWQKIVVFIIGVAIIAGLVKKFLYIPRPESDYGEMEAYDLELPDNFGVQTYLCPKMDKYDFLKRNIEIISPLVRNRNNPFKIALSPLFLEKSGRDIMRIAVTREIIQYRKLIQVKSYLGLISPILGIICLVEAGFAFGWNRFLQGKQGLVYFFGPFLIAVFVIVFLLLWNSRISKMDFKVDHELTKYFSKKDIENYILKWDQLIQPDEPELVNEKSRELEKFYLQQRIKKL